MVKIDGEYGGLTRLHEYLAHFMRFTPYYPGWIPVAQARLCNASDKIEKCVESLPYYVHYTRATRTFTVYDDQKRQTGTVSARGIVG